MMNAVELQEALAVAFVNGRQTSEKVVLYLQADENGEVYLTKGTDGIVIRQTLITTVENDVPTMKVVNL